MRRVLSLKLAFILIMSSMTFTPAFSEVEIIENNEATFENLSKVQTLTSLYQKECLPKDNLSSSELYDYHTKNGLTENCWRYITEIDHLDSEISKSQSFLEGQSCAQGNCLTKPDISDFDKIRNRFACTQEKKEKIQKNCSDDLKCVFLSSSTSIIGLGGLFTDKFLKSDIKNCDPKTDSCMTQMYTAFFKAAVTFFQGAWSIAKMAGTFVGDGVSKFWKSVTETEDHSSTSQLALAKASEDPSIFEELKKDFPRTMLKIWETFFSSIKNWLQTQVFCKKWAGKPHFSECLRPSRDFECMSCKTMVNGLCTLSGTFVAEIIPAFMSGGLVTAVKYGVQGAPKIAKVFKVSDASMDAIKTTSIGGKAATKTAVASNAALKAIQTYFLSPGRVLAKNSYLALKVAINKGKTQLAKLPTGNLIVFPATVLKYSTKGVLFPIDNAMTVMAYRAGARTADKAFILASPKIAQGSVVTSAILKKNPQLEDLLAKVKEAGSISDEVELAKLEEELVKKLRPIRKDATKLILTNDQTEFSDIVRFLYPELKYGNLSKGLHPQKVLKAERDLYRNLSLIEDSSLKNKLLTDYKIYIDKNPQRVQVVGQVRSPFDPEDVPANITGGAARFLSPTLRGADQNEKKRQERRKLRREQRERRLKEEQDKQK